MWSVLSMDIQLDIHPLPSLDADRVYDCAYNFVSVIPATSARI
jgi:hypothetical protein